MKILNIVLITIIALSLTGCHEEIIDVKLETAEPRLVIDAAIHWQKGTIGNEQKIVLSTTTAYYSEEFPKVSGASVKVTNSSNTIFDFVENNAGEYICSNFKPLIGEIYNLTINVDGETYTATETMTGVPTIENRVEQNDKGGMAGDEIELTFYYQDNGHEYNYYLYDFRMRHVIYPQYEIENNENNQGALTAVYYSHEDLEVGDEVAFKLYGISKRYYNYMNKILLASGNDDRPFPTTPAAVRGNIVNQTNNEKSAFGYFSLSEMDVKEYIVKEKDN